MCGNQKKLILYYKIKECIKQYYNELLYGYSKIIATMKFFKKMVVFLK